MAEKENSWLENLGNEMFMKERNKINSEFDKEIGRLYVRGADIGQIPLGGFVELSVNRLRNLCLARIRIDETLVSEQGGRIDDSQAERMVVHVEDVLANQFSRSLSAVCQAAHAGGLEKVIADVTIQLERERKRILEDMKREIDIKKGLSHLSNSEKEKAEKGKEESAIEHTLHIETVGMLRLIIGYFTTWWGMFRHPKITLRSLLLAKREPGYGIRAAAFLIINILIVLLIRGPSGDTLLKFPFGVHWALNIIPLVFRYLLGMIIFLFLFAWLTTKKRVRNYVFKVFPVFCYASVFFLPFFLMRMLCSKVMEGVFIDIMNMWPSLLSGLPVKFGVESYIRAVLSGILILIFLIWWLWLLYVGLGHVEPVQPGKKRFKDLTLAYFYFLVLKITAIFLVGFILYSSTFGAVKIIILEDIERALSTQPPDYATAHVLSERMANAKAMPVYVQYVAKLRSIVYQIALIAPPDSCKLVVDEAQKAISERDFKRAENIIGKYVKELLINKRDPMRSFYAQLARNLEEANELYKSPFYAEKERLFIFMPLPPAPIALFP